ncbi:MAG: S8 family serine peptidase [Candidatus Caenarcaniphilales bacterium]|nr:S8 family serine peptidase [Candidatus Caenarcaniphilales bacterium]
MEKNFFSDNLQNPHLEPEYTGRHIVVFDSESKDKASEILRSKIGVKCVNSKEFDHKSSLEQVDEEAIFLDKLGIAIIKADQEQVSKIQTLADQESEPVVSVEPETVVYALNGNGYDKDELILNYLQGYKDGIDEFYDRMTNFIKRKQEIIAEAEQVLPVTTNYTWGMQLTNVINSRYSGRGVRLVVLDTGFDLTHPDFRSRRIITQSFISGESIQDGNGHGTHCIGTSCGPLRPSNASLPRYGASYNAEIYVGKVLSNQGSGSDGGILAGINWAIANRCQVVSMSLGSQSPPSMAYEYAGRRALNQGSLIVAAAGNESCRNPRLDPNSYICRNNPGLISPIGSPANVLSIMAVGGVDRTLKIANFSNRGLYPQGGQIDIAGPGVDVYSSFPVSRGSYARLSGTSMATPHVAGIAALWCEATGQTGGALWSLLTRNARRLNLSSADVGAGLVQAPIR